MPTAVEDLGPATFSLAPAPDWDGGEDDDDDDELPPPLYNDPDYSSSEGESDSNSTAVAAAPVGPTDPPPSAAAATGGHHETFTVPASCPSRQYCARARTRTRTEIGDRYHMTQQSAIEEGRGATRIIAVTARPIAFKCNTNQTNNQN